MPRVDGLVGGVATTAWTHRTRKRNELENVEPTNIDKARRCFALIREIAEFGAGAWDPNTVGHVLQEFGDAFLRQTGREDPEFHLVPLDEMNGLDVLLAELQSLLEGIRTIDRRCSCH